MRTLVENSTEKTCNAVDCPLDKFCKIYNPDSEGSKPYPYFYIGTNHFGCDNFKSKNK